eukprot:7382144-Prymnesium_polylepis.2
MGNTNSVSGDAATGVRMPISDLPRQASPDRHNYVRLRATAVNGQHLNVAACAQHLNIGPGQTTARRRFDSGMRVTPSFALRKVA